MLWAQPSSDAGSVNWAFRAATPASQKLIGDTQALPAAKASKMRLRAMGQIREDLLPSKPAYAYQATRPLPVLNYFFRGALGFLRLSFAGDEAVSRIPGSGVF